MEMIFTVASDYSLVTGLRHSDLSENSGEDFYHKKLNGAFAEAFDKKEELVLILDGVIGGYTPSFLDEAIGNLVYDFSLSVVREYLKVISDNDSQWLVMLEKKTYPLWEQRRKKGPKATISVPATAWYKLVNGKLEKKVWITEITPSSQIK